MYTIKPIIEGLFPTLNTILEYSIIAMIIYETIIKIKKCNKLKYEKYLLVFFLLIIANGIYNGVANAISSRDYIQAVLNYGFIFLSIIYLDNSIRSKEDFIKILWMTRFNGVLIFIFAIYDKYILGLNRSGDFVNANFMSQMCIILLVFCYFSSSNKYSLGNLFYYAMTLFTVYLTGSNSGFLALIAILVLIFIFYFNSNKLINISYYLFWLILIFYMGIIIYTGNYNYGLLKIFVKSTDTSRIFMWEFTFNEFLNHPIMGRLYNSFRVPWGNGEMVTHNDYLRLLVELGISSILILFVFIRKQIQLLLGFEKSDAIFLYSMIIITLTFSLSHNNLNNFMFWLAFCLPSFSIYREKKYI